MKKILCTIALALLGLASSLSAQQASDLVMPTQPKVYQGFSLGTSGLLYKLEAVVAPEFSVGLQGGLGMNLGYSYRKSTVIINGQKETYSDSKFLFALRPVIGASGTYYYNLRSRAQRGYDVSYQAANYFRLAVDYEFKPFFQTPSGYYDDSSFSAYGLWGMRRHISSKIISDFSIGGVYTSYRDGGNSYDSWGPYVGIGFSYIF